MHLEKLHCINHASACYYSSNLVHITSKHGGYVLYVLVSWNPQ